MSAPHSPHIPPQNPAIFKSPAVIAHRHAVESNLLGISISVTLLAAIAIPLRFWARSKSKIGVGADDWLILPAMAFAFGNLSLLLILAKHGMGLPITQIHMPREALVLAEAIFAEKLTYFIGITLIKISILIMYCRAFSLRSIRIAAWVLSTMTVIWAIISCCVVIFACKPIKAVTDPLLPGKCFEPENIFIGTAVPNVLVDIAILTMPIYHVAKLHLPRIQRFTLMLVFMLGCFVIFASAYRFTSVVKHTKDDFSIDMKLPALWSHIELCMAIVSACLPTMRPLLQAALKSLGLEGGHRSPENNVGSVGTIGGTKKVGHAPEKREERGEVVNFEDLSDLEDQRGRSKSDEA